MTKAKYFIMIALASILLFITPTMVNAVDKYNATSTINGVTANWEYELNESNEIEELICKNVSELSGKISIPDNIDGKKVVSLGYRAFYGSNTITEVILPNTLQKVGGYAFDGCTKLSNINFGTGVQWLNVGAFKDCKSLTEITIPKNLIKDCGNYPFEGCTNITNVTFEDGITQIPAFICKGLTGITEINIPNSVKKIGGYAFDGCTKLSNINFGTGVQWLNVGAFKDCKSLTEITIPKNLIKDCGNYPFEGCTNITNVTFEDGITQIPAFICKGLTGLTKFNIPESVTKIGGYAFDGCSNLEQDIILPINTTYIGIEVFSNCPKLNKVVFLGDIRNIGWGENNSAAGDSVFKNHNENLTLYCYENSKPAVYAINNNIKYVYMEKSNTPINKEQQNETNQQQVSNEIENSTNTSIKTKDITIANSSLPRTGTTIIGMVSISAVVIIGLIFYIKCRKLKDI